MRDWFPFTIFDFFSYVACGLTLLFAADYCHQGTSYLMRDEWTALQGALVVSLSYVVGQLLAIPSSLLLEHAISRCLLRAPAVVMLGQELGFIESTINILIGRHYEPLPEGTKKQIFLHAARDTGLEISDVTSNPREVFPPALAYSRQNERINIRIETFRVQYVFARNMCLTSILSAGLTFHAAYFQQITDAWIWFNFSCVCIVGMFLRFFKFYSCCASEALRAYAFKI